jgi:hypothetical protein
MLLGDSEVSDVAVRAHLQATPPPIVTPWYKETGGELAMLLLLVMICGGVFWFLKKDKRNAALASSAKSDDKRLFYKSCETAFESACKYGGHDLQIGSTLVAIVLDARKEAGSDEAVKTLANGRQLALLKVSSADGGFVVMAETPSAAGPKLNVGDLVLWHIGAYSKEVAKIYGDPRAGWVGLIVATVKLEYSIKQGWQLDAIFAPESMD